MKYLKIRCDCTKKLRLNADMIGRGFRCSSCQLPFPSITQQTFDHLVEITPEDARVTVSEYLASVQGVSAPVPPAKTPSVVSAPVSPVRPPSSNSVSLSIPNDEQISIPNDLKAEPNPSSRWRVGQVIEERYEVKRLLGEGTFGSVWQVWDQEHQMDLAVKELRADKGLTPERKQSFLRESRAWILELGLHPNIVTAWWVLELDNTPRLFLEYCSRGSLSDWIEQGNIRDLTTAIDIGIQLCWGLAHCHSKKIIHRDFKPLNILMTPEGDAKITDFGTVKFAASDILEGTELNEIHDLRKTIGGRLQGTPPYMPPEQWSRGVDVTPQADLYAFGVTLYEMITGEYPVQPKGRSIPEWALAHSTTPIPSIQQKHADIPNELDKLFQQCLAKDPKQRPQSATEIASRLIQIYEQIKGEPYPRTAPSEADLLADSLNNQGVSLAVMNDPKEARRAWEKALKVDPTHPETTYNLALTRWRNAEIDDLEAVRMLNEVCSMHPDSWNAHLALALIHIERDDSPAALAALNKVNPTGHAAERKKQLIEQIQKRGNSTGLIRTFEGHTNRISSVTFSSDDTLVLSGSWDSTLKLWDVASGKCIQTFEGHKAAITSVCLSPSGKFALSGSEDKTAKLWEIASGRCLRTFSGFRYLVGAVLFSRSEKFAITTGDPEIKLWDIRTGECLQKIHADEFGVNSIDWSIDELTIVSGGNDKKIKLWDVKTGACLRTMEGHTNAILSVRLTPDGRQLASGGSDNAARLWDCQTGKLLQTFSGHTDTLSSVFPVAEGSYLVTSSWDRTVKFWNGKTGHCLRSIEAHTDGIGSFSLSRDTKFVVTGGWDCTLKLWSINELKTTEKATYLLSNPRLVADLSTQARYRALLQESQNSPVSALKMLKEARLLQGFANQKEGLQLWRNHYSIQQQTTLKNVIQLSKLQTINGGYCGTMTGNGIFAIFGGWNLLMACEVKTGRILWKISDLALSYGVNSVSLSRTGKIAATANSDATISILDPKIGGTLRVLRGHIGSVTSVCLTADGKKAISGSVDNSLKIWDTRVGHCLSSLEAHSLPVGAVSLSLDDSMACSGSDDRYVNIWDLQTGRCLKMLPGHQQPINDVCFSRNQTRILSGSWDNRMIMWNIKTGECQEVFEGHTEGILTVCFSNNGKLAISGSHDKTVKIWDTQTGECIRTLFGHATPIRTVCLTDDDGILLTHSEDGVVNVWFLDWELEPQEK